MTKKIHDLTMRENPGRRLLAAFPNMRHRAFEERLSAFMTRLRERGDKVQESLGRFPAGGSAKRREKRAKV